MDTELLAVICFVPMALILVLIGLLYQRMQRSGASALFHELRDSLGGQLTTPSHSILEFIPYFYPDYVIRGITGSCNGTDYRIEEIIRNPGQGGSSLAIRVSVAFVSPFSLYVRHHNNRFKYSPVILDGKKYGDFWFKADDEKSAKEFMGKNLEDLKKLLAPGRFLDLKVEHNRLNALLGYDRKQILEALELLSVIAKKEIR